MNKFTSPLCAVMALAAGIGAAAADEVRDTMKVCVAELQPWIYVDDGDQVTGFEVDALKGLSDALDVETSFVVKSFEQLKPALLDGECDLIASGFSITFDRIEDVAFSLPYNHTEYHLLVPVEMAKQITDLEGFNQPDMHIGHLAGGVSGQVAEEYFPDAKRVPLERRMDSLDAFREGRIDAYVSSDPFDRIIEEAAPGEFTIFDDELLRVSIEAFVVRQEDADLLDQINPFVIKGVNENYFLDLHRKWFTLERMMTGF